MNIRSTKKRKREKIKERKAKDKRKENNDNDNNGQNSLTCVRILIEKSSVRLTLKRSSK